MRSCTVPDVSDHRLSRTRSSDAGRSWHRDRLVSGNVDFIFGAGRAVFEARILQSRAAAQAET